MKLFAAPAWLRAFLLFGGIVIWIGIWDTGPRVVSWILYVPAVMFVFGAVTGICPGVILTRMVFGRKGG